MTGWGQDGPYASTAGHDINYISLAGALIPSAGAEAPVRPSTWSATSAAAACCWRSASWPAYWRRTSGRGQVIDAAMVDGAAALMTMTHSLRAMGIWNDERHQHARHRRPLLRRVRDRRRRLRVDRVDRAPVLRRAAAAHRARGRGPGAARPARRLKERLAGIFRTKTRDEWCEIMEGTDVCFAPVLTIPEAVAHPHNVHRGTFVEVAGSRSRARRRFPAPGPPSPARRPTCRAAHGRDPGRGRRRRRPHRQAAETGAIAWSHPYARRGR